MQLNVEFETTEYMYVLYIAQGGVENLYYRASVRQLAFCPGEREQVS